LRTLQLVSALAGERYEATQSYSQNGSPVGALFGAGHYSTGTTTHWQRVPAIRVDEISRLAPGTALTMGSGTQPCQVRLVSAWEDPWRAVIERAG